MYIDDGKTVSHPMEVKLTQEKPNTRTNYFETHITQLKRYAKELRGTDLNTKVMFLLIIFESEEVEGNEIIEIFFSKV